MKKICSNFIFNVRWLWLSTLLVGAGFGFTIVNKISNSSQPIEAATILICLGLLAALVLLDFIESGERIRKSGKSFKVYRDSDLARLSESVRGKHICVIGKTCPEKSKAMLIPLSVDAPGKNQAAILFMPTHKQATAPIGIRKPRKQGGAH